MREVDWFYYTKQWKACRREYAKTQGGLCERCREKGIIRAGAIVHHKIPVTPENVNDPSITLNFDNLMYVCRDCHAAIHKPTKRFKVDDLGRVTPI